MAVTCPLPLLVYKPLVIAIDSVAMDLVCGTSPFTRERKGLVTLLYPRYAHKGARGKVSNGGNLQQYVIENRQHSNGTKPFEKLTLDQD